MIKTSLKLVVLIFLLAGCSNNEVKDVEENHTLSDSSLVQTTQTTQSSIVKETSNSTENVVVASGTLLRAVEARKINEVKDVLKDTTYYLDEQNAQGETPLLIATHNDDVEIAKLLIDAGADVNKQDNIQDSAYLYAAAQGKTDILKYMLEKTTPDQSVYNRFGGNAIIPAAEKGHLENVKLLIKDGKVDLNHQNNYGYTALIEAVALRDGSKVYQDIVSELLKAGADKSLRDNSGRNAQDYAREYGYDIILKQLQ